MVVDNDTLVRNFVNTFTNRDVDLLAPFLDEDVVYRNYGDPEVHGRDQVLNVWREAFHKYETVRFETVNQAVNGSIVLAEQIHGLALPGKQMATTMNMAVYEVHDEKIHAWREYTNPQETHVLL